MDATELIIASDIFGRTPELLELASAFSARYDQIHIIDPYHGRNVNFPDKQAAYQYFQKHGRIEKLAQLVLEKIAASNALLDLVGFSVGASAIWSLSETGHSGRINRAICFYGSRIRDMADKAPRFRIQLIFPARENHFDVARLASVLSKKINVECIQTEFLHGFMNRQSENYNAEGYREFIGRMK